MLNLFLKQQQCKLLSVYKVINFYLRMVLQVANSIKGNQ